MFVYNKILFVDIIISSLPHLVKIEDYIDYSLIEEETRFICQSNKCARFCRLSLNSFRTALKALILGECSRNMAKVAQVDLPFFERSARTQRLEEDEDLLLLQEEF